MRKRLLCLLCGVLLVACKSDGNREEEAYRQYGINCMESGKYEDAIDSFQKALDKSPGKVGETELDICFYKARAHYLNGEIKEALSIYEAVIAYNQDGRAYYLRGNLRLDLGETEKALEDYKKAVEAEKNNYELFLGIYESLVSHNKKEEALPYLEQAEQIEGEDASACLYQGRIHYLKQEYDAAIEALLKAEKGKEPLAAYYLGLSYEAKGDKTKAEEYLKRYLDSGIASSYDLYQLGSNEAAAGDYAQAIVYFEAGLAMDNVPNKQNLMKGAVSAYEYNGDFASAKRMLTEYLKLYPSDEEAKKEAAFLETR